MQGVLAVFSIYFDIGLYTYFMDFFLDSAATVMRFARATGDSHSLSSVDVRLLALAHTLEVHYYGSAHLRTQPPPPKVAKKKARDSKHLPGWGAEGGDWAELDKLNEEELAAAEAALMAGRHLLLPLGFVEALGACRHIRG